MKKAILFILVIVLGSCSKSIEPDTKPLETGQISGTVLWNRITEEADYKSYSFWPGHEGIQPGQSPHGAYHRIYINKVLFDALPVKTKISPIGTIIVKENLSSAKVLDSITVMTKVRNYNPEIGDWFWAKYSPEGKVLAEGTPKGCISCHKGMSANDYVIVRALDTDLIFQK